LEINHSSRRHSVWPASSQPEPAPGAPRGP
jgi:hypothetical protein